MRLGGVVVAMRERPLKCGAGRMAFLTLDDLHGSCEVLVFSKVFAEHEAALEVDEPLPVRGVPIVEGDDEGGVQVELRALDVERLADARIRHTELVRLVLRCDEVDEAAPNHLEGLLRAHRGPVPVSLTLVAAGRFEADLRLGDALRVTPSEELLAWVHDQFGRSVAELS